jgi:hypothetical protein
LFRKLTWDAQIATFVSALLSGTTPAPTFIPHLATLGQNFNISNPGNAQIAFTPVSLLLQSLSLTLQGFKNAIQMYSLNFSQYIAVNSSKAKRQVSVMSQCNFSKVNGAADGLTSAFKGLVSTLDALDAVFSKFDLLKYSLTVLRRYPGPINSIFNPKQPPRPRCRLDLSGRGSKRRRRTSCPAVCIDMPQWSKPIAA